MSLKTYLDPLFEELNCPLLTNLYESKEGILYEVFRVEADELWSFVGSRSNKQWLWMVMNTADRKIIAFQLGDRTINTALQLLDKVPQMVKEKATFFTDFWISYRCIEQEKHVTAGKEKGYTNHIERFNNTLRQRCSRLVRKALSFSKKLENHIGAIKYFICNYNKQIALHL